MDGVEGYICVTNWHGEKMKGRSTLPLNRDRDVDAKQKVPGGSEQAQEQLKTIAKADT